MDFKPTLANIPYLGGIWNSNGSVGHLVIFLVVVFPAWVVILYGADPVVGHPSLPDGKPKSRKHQFHLVILSSLQIFLYFNIVKSSLC